MSRSTVSPPCSHAATRPLAAVAMPSPSEAMTTPLRLRSVEARPVLHVVAPAMSMCLARSRVLEGKLVDSIQTRL